LAGTEDDKATWGQTILARTGGGGWRLDARRHDTETNTVWWGTANQRRLLWSGADWEKSGAAPGTNLYTTSGHRIDPDTGNAE